MRRTSGMKLLVMYTIQKIFFKIWYKQYNVFSSLRTKNSLSFKNGKQTYEIFKNANKLKQYFIHNYIYIYNI